jgi:hypothetical protein
VRHNLVVSGDREGIAFLRERYLGESWEITDDPDLAIQALEREPFDRLFLDHWLGREPKNGRDVSLYLGNHPECNPRIQVICTTVDRKKGQQIAQECGRLAHHVPMDLIKALGA